MGLFRMVVERPVATLMVFIAAAVGKYFIRVSISGGVEVLMRGSTDVDTKCASICCIDDGVRASLHREC